MIRKIFRNIPLVYTIWHNVRLKINQKKEINKKIAYDRWSKEILLDVSEIVVKKGYKCICNAGTLLGLMRDGELIPWDDDLDFSIIVDSEFDWIRFENDMKCSGFWKCRECKMNDATISQAYKKKDVVCDFSLWKNDKEIVNIIYDIRQIQGKQYDNGKMAEYDVYYKKIPRVKGIILKNYGSGQVPIPENYNEILEALYGEKWKIPDPNYRSKDEMRRQLYEVKYWKKPINFYFRK